MDGFFVAGGNEFKEAQIAAFDKASPGIDVELLISPDYGTQIRAGFASGDYAEVFTVGQFDFPQWQYDGLLAPGSMHIEAQDDIYQGLRDAFTADGELYCAAKDFSTLALLYTVDAFVTGASYATAPIFPLGFGDFDAAVNDATTLVMTMEEDVADALGEAADVAREIQAEME